MTEDNVPASSLGRWVSELRFEFDPPLQLAPGSKPAAITAFDLTPVGDVPGVRENRQKMLDEFVWDGALQDNERRRRG